jgi:hypothetical protein
VWRIVRTVALLLVLIGVAAHTWLDRAVTTSWKEPLWVGIFPINGDGSAVAQQYVDSLTPRDFEGIESFFEREAPRFGVSIEHPVRVELYPASNRVPPLLTHGAGPLGIAWWSLKLRWFAAHAADVPGRAPARIRIFVLYHDPATLRSVPDSHGVQKGLMGVVYAFAARSMARSNSIVIAHELLHTLGATDKYDFGTGAPSYPDGFADPDRSPRYPQGQAEIMAGRRALSAQDFEMPQSLRDVVVGPKTAAEVRWTHR